MKKKWSLNKKYTWLYIIALIVLIMDVFLIVQFSIKMYDKKCYELMIEAINDNDIQKLEKVLKIGGKTDYAPSLFAFDMLAENINDKTPLQLACYNGNLDIVKLLVENGADVNYVQHNAIYSPLICAIDGKTENDLEIVKFLVKNGADVNYQCNVKRPVISWLVDSKKVSKNGLEILKHLIASGADSKKLNYLMDVCYWKHDDMIKYFINEGQYAVAGGDTIQQYCRGVNKFSLEIFELLISNGADIYEVDEDGKSAIDYLIETTGGDTYWVDVMVSLYENYNSGTK